MTTQSSWIQQHGSSVAASNLQIGCFIFVVVVVVVVVVLTLWLPDDMNYAQKRKKKTDKHSNKHVKNGKNKKI